MINLGCSRSYIPKVGAFIYMRNRLIAQLLRANSEIYNDFFTYCIVRKRPKNIFEVPLYCTSSVHKTLCQDLAHSHRLLNKLFYSYCLLLSRCSRQRERLSGSVLSICLFVCRSVCRQNAKNATFSKTKQFKAMVSIDYL